MKWRRLWIFGAGFAIGVAVLAIGAGPYTRALSAPDPTMTPVPDALTITILYDNSTDDPDLRADWGFSAQVVYHDHVMLFDAGAQPDVLRHNMTALAIDPAAIEVMALSHAHSDHVGGLPSLLGDGGHPDVYLLPSFPPSIKNRLAVSLRVYEVAQGQALGDDIFTTGEIEGAIPEQALVIDTPQGLVIITGCAHPGIVEIIERAQELFDRPVYLVMGGFHLLEHDAESVAAIIEQFRDLGVQKVAPMHCTGDEAIAMFQQAYGDDFIRMGVGAVVTIGREPDAIPE